MCNVIIENIRITNMTQYNEKQKSAHFWNRSKIKSE